MGSKTKNVVGKCETRSRVRDGSAVFFSRATCRFMFRQMGAARVSTRRRHRCAFCGTGGHNGRFGKPEKPVSR